MIPFQAESQAQKYDNVMQWLLAYDFVPAKWETSTSSNQGVGQGHTYNGTETKITLSHRLSGSGAQKVTLHFEYTLNVINGQLSNADATVYILKGELSGEVIAFFVRKTRDSFWPFFGRENRCLASVSPYAGFPHCSCPALQDSSFLLSNPGLIGRRC